jgi:hypothetical protein
MTAIILCFTTLLAAGPVEDPEVIENIRSRYKQIKKERKRYKKRSTNFRCANAVCQVTAYFRRRRLRIIEEKIGGEYCAVDTDYFFWKGKLFFAFRRQDCKYPDGNTTFEQERFYFHEGKCMRYLSKKANSEESLAEAKNQKREPGSAEPRNVLSMAVDLRKLFKR